jgi:hypothetical protein
VINFPEAARVSERPVDGGYSAVPPRRGKPPAASPLVEHIVAELRCCGEATNWDTDPGCDCLTWLAAAQGAARTLQRPVLMTVVGHDTAVAVLLDYAAAAVSPRPARQAWQPAGLPG